MGRRRPRCGPRQRMVFDLPSQVLRGRNSNILQLPVSDSCIGAVGPAAACFSNYHVLTLGGVDQQAQGHRLSDHPGQRDLGQRGFFFRVPAADVGVDSCEPDLLAIRLLVWLWEEQIGQEEVAALVDGEGVAEVDDGRVDGRVREGLEVPEQAERTDGVPVPMQWIRGLGVMPKQRLKRFPPANRSDIG